ncbi:MAG TPA: sulfite reductase subunit alpha, partial [Bacillota bacterium]|nr:sulfite reductase subunit alpha [Bacillota bacterium]
FADHTEVFLKNIPVYIQESRSFRLPRDPATDIIMCGPGTGLAPFRAFLQQRVLDGATGRNWLFFGAPHRATDFLYGEELLQFHKQGQLHRLDLAFSRDQAHKVYVQHRMLEQSKDLWSWLQGGACFYVCGDAKNMAKDVHQTLIAIAQKEGSLSPEAAADYVNVTLMKTEKRYLRDVY